MLVEGKNESTQTTQVHSGMLGAGWVCDTAPRWRPQPPDLCDPIRVPGKPTSASKLLCPEERGTGEAQWKSW